MPRTEKTFLERIVSPMKGIFCRGRPEIVSLKEGVRYFHEGEASPLIDIGDIIKREKTILGFIILDWLGLIEIKSHISGEIVDVLCEDGQEVNGGDPIFMIRPIKIEEEEMDKARFIRLIKRKYEGKIVIEKEGRNQFSYLPNFPNLLGCSTPSSNYDAVKDLYKQLWEYFDFLRREEDRLDRKPREDLRSFRSILM